MSSLDLDPRYTYDTFVVGAANRLAAAAARRVAEAPGAAYNPLFLYSASGLGKTHLVTALGHHARRLHPRMIVAYHTLEHLLDTLMTAIQAGERDAFRERLRGAGMLILDDVQFLAGRRGAQEELLRAWDALSAGGGQVVLASDRPPAEIDELDDRLLSRFSGGLIADITAPDYETRVAILKRKAEGRGQALADGIAELLARAPYRNVRELQGGLNRVLAVQELDERTVGMDEAIRLLELPQKRAADADEFGSFLSEIAGVVTAAIAEPSAEQLLADAILRWEGEGYRTHRLEQALSESPTVTEAEARVAAFTADIRTLDAAAQEIRALDGGARELARLDILRDPDRTEEAHALVAQVRERTRPLPPPPPQPTFAALSMDPSLFAVRAARAIAEAPGGAYNPFLIYGTPGTGRSSLLIAIANELRTATPTLPIAFLSGTDFSTDLIGALERNQIDAWRARMRTAGALIIDDVDALAGTERAQEELFHLFDELRGRGAQLVFSTAAPPRELAGLEDRLRTRLESGLVVDMKDALAGGTVIRPATAGVMLAQPVQPALDAWFLSKEKVVWEWPDAGAWLVEELD